MRQISSRNILGLRKISSRVWENELIKFAKFAPFLTGLVEGASSLRGLTSVDEILNTMLRMNPDDVLKQIAKLTPAERTAAETALAGKYSGGGLAALEANAKAAKDARSLISGIVSGDPAITGAANIDDILKSKIEVDPKSFLNEYMILDDAGKAKVESFLTNKYPGGYTKYLNDVERSFVSKFKKQILQNPEKAKEFFDDPAKVNVTRSYEGMWNSHSGEALDLKSFAETAILTRQRAVDVLKTGDAAAVKAKLTSLKNSGEFSLIPTTELAALRNRGFNATELTEIDDIIRGADPERYVKVTSLTAPRAVYFNDSLAIFNSSDEASIIAKINEFAGGTRGESGVIRTNPSQIQQIKDAIKANSALSDAQKTSLISGIDDWAAGRMPNLSPTVTPTTPPGTPPTSQPGTPPTSQPGTPPTSQPGTPPTSQPGTPPAPQPGTPPARPTTSPPGAPPVSSVLSLQDIVTAVKAETEVNKIVQFLINNRGAEVTDDIANHLLSLARSDTGKYIQEFAALSDAEKAAFAALKRSGNADDILRQIDDLVLRHTGGTAAPTTPTAPSPTGAPTRINWDKARRYAIGATVLGLSGYALTRFVSSGETDVPIPSGLPDLFPDLDGGDSGGGAGGSSFPQSGEVTPQELADGFKRASDILIEKGYLSTPQASWTPEFDAAFKPFVDEGTKNNGALRPTNLVGGQTWADAAPTIGFTPDDSGAINAVILLSRFVSKKSGTGAMPDSGGLGGGGYGQVASKENVLADIISRLYHNDLVEGGGGIFSNELKQTQCLVDAVGGATPVGFANAAKVVLDRNPSLSIILPERKIESYLTKKNIRKHPAYQAAKVTQETIHKIFEKANPGIINPGKQKAVKNIEAFLVTLGYKFASREYRGLMKSAAERKMRIRQEILESLTPAEKAIIRRNKMREI